MTVVFSRLITSRPQQPVALDLSNPLAVGATAYLPSAVVGPAQKFRTYSSRVQVGGGIVSATDSATTIGSANTFLVVANLRSLSVDAVMLGRVRYNGSTNLGSALRVNNSAIELTKGPSSGWSYSKYSAGSAKVGRHVYVGSTVAGANSVLYVDGVPLQVATSDIPTAGIVAFDGAMDLGKGTASGATAITGTIDGYIELAVYWPRALSAHEFKTISDNPWQIFAPIRGRLFEVPAGGGSSGTVEYTNANDTSSASGTTTVVGTSSTTNANDTSSASGTTTVTGTVNYTNANDTSAASGTAGSTTGTVDYTNANDTATASGWAGTVSGTVDYTNNDDTSTAQGQVVGVESDRASGGFAWLEYISDREREEYRKKRREVYQNAPKKVTAVVKKVAQKAAIEQRELEPEEIEQAFESEGVAYQPDYGQMAQNAYRLYLQLLINRRKLEQEAEKEREQTRQFIAEQTRIALEDQQRRAQLIEEEAVFMTVAALLLD